MLDVKIITENVVNYRKRCGNSLPVSLSKESGRIMFEVNDVIVYGKSGICKVVEIGPIALSRADRKKEYYTLRPIYQHEAVIYVPVDNSKTVMRPVISKEEAEQLIADIQEIETVWIVNEREREAQYRSAISTCDCRELVKIIKTLYQRKKIRLKDGKKVTVVDERYFRMAEEQLYGELAYALGIDKNQVADYITDSIMEKSES